MTWGELTFHIRQAPREVGTLSICRSTVGVAVGPRLQAELQRARTPQDPFPGRSPSRHHRDRHGPSYTAQRDDQREQLGG